MQTVPAAIATNISDVENSLSGFYNLTAKLSKLRFVRFTGKEDEADTIQWIFTYRKRKFTLQYSIYNGIALLSDDSSNQKLLSKLLSKLQLGSL